MSSLRTHYTNPRNLNKESICFTLSYCKNRKYMPSILQQTNKQTPGTISKPPPFPPSSPPPLFAFRTSCSENHRRQQCRQLDIKEENRRPFYIWGKIEIKCWHRRRVMADVWVDNEQYWKKWRDGRGGGQGEGETQTHNPRLSHGFTRPEKNILWVIIYFRFLVMNRMQLITISLYYWNTFVIIIIATTANVVIRGRPIIFNKPKLNIISPLIFCQQSINLRVCIYLTDFLFYFFLSRSYSSYTKK